MTNKKPISPFLGGLSSNGDSSSEDDDVFLNSRLDVISRNCDGMDDQLEYPNPNSSFLNFKMDENSVSSVFTPSPKIGAVRFSLFFSGKYFGEVGLFEPEISVFDWDAFREYVFGIIHVGNFESHIISYCDEDGDKIPIESDEDYQEVIKVAKFKACNDDREPVALYITRIGNSFPNSLRSLVSSSLRRVNSVGGSKMSIASQPLKKDVTTSTSFQNLGKHISHSIELNSNEVSPSWVPIPSHIEELNSPQENYFGETHQSYDKLFYECPAHPRPKETIPRSYSAYQPSPIWNTNVGRQDSTESSANVPLWFSCYMKQFKEDLSLEVSSKIEERFEEAVGNLSATDVEAKLRGLLTGYSTELQNKVLCCCKSSAGHCYKIAPIQNSLISTSHIQEETSRASLMTPLDRFEHREDSLDAESINNQDYFLQKLLKREQEILDFLDNTNEKIKQKIKVNNDYADSLRSCLTKELAIEERERVLARIEDFRQRQSRTTNDIKMLQQTMEVNNEGIARLALQDLVPPKDYDAKFIRDESFADGSKVEPKQQFTKHWAVQNTGVKPWDNETFLVCQSYHHMKPSSQSITCPSLKPGELGVISADFTAPATPGIFSTEWRFMQGDKLFGNHLWCTVIVPAKTEILTEKLSHFIPESKESISSVSEVPCLEELVRRKLFTHRDSITTPVDYLPRKFEKSSIEYYSYISKDSLCQMSSEDVLYYLMYIIRIIKPDFTTLVDRLPLKFLIKCLSRGSDRDYDNLSLFLDKNFVEKCTRDNFKDKDMEECYKELFLTGKDDNIDELTKKLQERYLHNSFNYSFDSSDDDIKEDTINGRETAPLEGVLFYEEVKDVPQCDNDIEEILAASYSCDVNYESEQHLDYEEFDNFDELVNKDGQEQVEQEIELEEHEANVEELPIVESNLVDEASDLNLEIIDADEKNEEIVSNQLVKPIWQLIHEASVVPCGMESMADTEDERCSEHAKESDGEQENEIRVGEDCEDECSSSYSEYSESDSSLESEDEENAQKENPIESDVENVVSNAEDHVSCEEEEVEEEEVVEEPLLPTGEQAIDRVCGSYGVDGDMKHPETSRSQEKDIKKNITSLHENFKQNVEIRLDFEVISRQPLAGTSYRENGSTIHADALTFQEKHFTVSSRPPPDPVQVPESDDESFDGLVFIRDTDIPSVPPTEPCSPSNPPRLSHPVVNEYERSVSCSSFSEYDDEDAEDAEEVARGNGLPDTADSSIHESESTDVCSESSSSPVVDEASSIYYESSLPEDVLEQFYSVRSDEKKDENCIKSPDTNADSGSSTSHTLRDAVASESSGSYDVNEAPVVDIAQEESTSEFEYVANVDN